MLRLIKRMSLFAILSCLLLFQTFNMAFATQPIHFEMNEIIHNTTEDYIHDTTGYHIGEIHGHVSLVKDQNDLHNEAIDFDNQYLDHNHITVSHSSAPQFSVSTWVKLDDADTSQVIASFFNSGNGADYRGWYLWNTSTDIQFRVHNGGTDFSFAVSDTPLKTGQWCNITATCDGEDLKLYIDGLLSGTATLSSEYQPPPETQNLYLGAYNYGSSANSLYMDGQMSDLKLFTYEVSQMEVSRLADLGTHYEMDDITSGHIYDRGVPRGDIDGTVELVPDQNGFEDEAVNFDNQDHVIVSHSDIKRFGSALQFSVSTWVRLDNADTSQVIASFFNSGNGANYRGWYLWNTDTAPYIRFAVHNGGTNFSCAGRAKRMIDVILFIIFFLQPKVFFPSPL